MMHDMQVKRDSTAGGVLSHSSLFMPNEHDMVCECACVCLVVDDAKEICPCGPMIAPIPPPFFLFFSRVKGETRNRHALNRYGDPPPISLFFPHLIPHSTPNSSQQLHLFIVQVADTKL
jgi:hypothetical protein